MNRQRLFDAIWLEYKNRTSTGKEQILVEALKTMSDSNLIMFAQDIGIDTDKILTEQPANVFHAIFPTKEDK